MRWRLPKSYVTEVTVSAAIEDVWAVVSDPTRVGEWSSEARTIEWLDGATGPGAGVKFRGHSQVGWRKWGKTCEIVDFEPPRRFVFRTSAIGDTNVWSFDLTPTTDGSGGTLIRQEFRILHLARPFEILYYHVTPTHQDRSAELRDDLQRIGQIAARHVSP